MLKTIQSCCCIIFLGEWDISCNELQRILIVRSIRQDRVSFCTSSFITNNLGSRFVEPPILSFKSVLDESTCKTPLLFVLSPGVVSLQEFILVIVKCFLVRNSALGPDIGLGGCSRSKRNDSQVPYIIPGTGAGTICNTTSLKRFQRGRLKILLT